MKLLSQIVETMQMSADVETFMEVSFFSDIYSAKIVLYINTKFAF